MSAVIPRDKWKWIGMAGHFIGSADCRFHLCTIVGKHMVSTVGDYRPKHAGGGRETIGWDRTYETMVFRAGKPCSVEGCACGVPDQESGELDFEGYNDAKAATAGHMRMCAKWAKWKRSVK